MATDLSNGPPSRVLRFPRRPEPVEPTGLIVAICEDRVVLADSEHPKLMRHALTAAQVRSLMAELALAVDQLEPPEGPGRAA